MNYTFGMIEKLSCKDVYTNQTLLTKLDNTYYKYIFNFQLKNPLDGISLYKRKKKIYNGLCCKYCFTMRHNL